MKTPAAEATEQQGGHRCALCGQKAARDFLTVNHVSAHVGTLCSSREAAKQADSGEIQLAYCEHCGLVFNRLFDPNKVQYAPGYDISLNHSANYRRFVEGTIQRLVDDYHVRDRSIVEVGCGSGYFLRDLCRAGDNAGTGFDPCAATDGWPDERVKLVRDLYGDAHTEVPVDLLCCRHVLQHIQHPTEFIRMLRGVVGDRMDATIYFELPNGRFVFEQGATWNCFYEHCSYIGEDCLRRLFADCGFEVLEAGPCYDDDQYLYAVARPIAAAENGLAESPAKVNSSPISASLTWDMCAAYARAYERTVARRNAELQPWIDRDCRIVAWGSGGRGISFLQAVAAAKHIEYVVDINPDRQGGYIPLTGQHVIAPEFLTQYRPDLVVLTNPTYEQEIKRQLSDLNVQCEFLMA